MSEEKKLRTEDEIRSEYTNLCTKAGHLQLQITVLKEDLAVVNSTLKDLNFEALNVRRAREEEAKKASESVEKVSE